MINKYLEKTIDLFHNAGKMPDRYYYQLNGASSQDNYKAQHYEMMDNLEEGFPDVHITSEVKIK